MAVMAMALTSEKRVFGHVIASVDIDRPEQAELLNRAIERELRDGRLSEGEREWLVAKSRQLGRLRARAAREGWPGWGAE